MARVHPHFGDGAAPPAGIRFALEHHPELVRQCLPGVRQGVERAGPQLAVGVAVEAVHDRPQQRLEPDRSGLVFAVAVAQELPRQPTVFG